MTAPITGRQALLLTLPPLMWAGNAVVGRLMVGQVPPLLLNTLRWSLVAVLLLPFAWRVVGSAAARHELAIRWKALALVGLLGVGAYNALQYLALTTSPPLNVTLIAASGPVWMMAVGAWFYGERPTRRQAIGAAWSLAGVLVVLSRGDPSALAQVRLARGDLLMLVAVISWAFYSWQLARPSPSLREGARPAWGFAEFMLVQTLFGLAWTWSAAGAEALLAPAEVQWSWRVAAALLFVAIGPSLIAYGAWNAGVATAGPALAAIFANLTSPFAAVLSALVLGEWPQAYHGVAFALIAIGIAVTSRQASAAPATGGGRQ